MQVLASVIILSANIIGDFRFEYEYKIKYENDFSILVCRLHIITSHTHFNNTRIKTHRKKGSAIIEPVPSVRQACMKSW